MNILAELFGLPLKDFNEWEIRWRPDDSGWILVVLCILVPVALAFFWSSLSRIQSRNKRAFLLGLRVLVYAFLFLILFQPQLEFSQSRLLTNSIAVLLDDSKSLSIKTFPEEKSRLDIVRHVLESNREYFEKLQENFQVDFYFVSDKIASVAWDGLTEKYRARGLRTDLNRALREVKKRYEGKSLQGVMLFSDGADLGEDPSEISAEFSETLASFVAPVHTFQAGSNKNFKDLGIEKVETADFGFVHQEIDLSVRVSAFSMGNKNIPLVVKEGEKVLVSKILQIREGQTQYKTQLRFTVNTVGKRVYSLSVPLFAGESIETNNVKEFQIEALRDRIRVLHLNGRPAWDNRFLREVLINNPKVDLLSFFILRNFSDDVQAATSELSLIPFPSNLLLSDYLGSFDLVIFHNFKFAPFLEKKYLENIRRYVQKGGAFMMIGGDLSFQGGEYERTAVEDILPVRIQNKSKQFLQEEFRVQMDKRFVRHPILRLEKNEDLNEEAWTSLPELSGLNIGLVPAKDAQVLISYAKEGNPEVSYPVLAIREIGEGRTLVLTTDSSWNWNFLRVGKGGSGRYYQKFWDNVTAWMTKAPETHLIKIESDKDKYGENDKVLIKIKILRDDYNPLPGEKIDLVFHSLSKRRDVSSHALETDESGEAVFELVPPDAGFYSVRVEMDYHGERLGRETRFSVFSPTTEFDKLRVNSLLLQAMAEATAGEYTVLNERTDLSRSQFANPEIQAKSKSITLSLWDNWWSYGMIVAFLSADWWMRRRSGLS